MNKKWIKLVAVMLLILVTNVSFLDNSVEAMSTVNVIAPDFTMTMLDGSTVHLSDNRGKITVLIFGKTLTCSNTRFELVMANSLAETFYQDKVNFIVSEVTSFDEGIFDYIKENNLDNLAFSSDNTGNPLVWEYINLCYGYYYHFTLPATFIIDSNGYLRYYSTNIVTYSDLQTSLISIGGDEILNPSMAKNKSELYEINEKIYNTARSDEKALNYYKEATACIQSDNSDIVSLSKQLTDGITDDYDKLKAIHSWVCNNIYYDYDYFYRLNDTTSLGALETLTNKYSVCQGFAELTAALLRAADIPCKLVSGYASGLGYGSDQEWAADILTSNEPNHAWNEAYVNGRWIVLDTTWDTGNRYQYKTFIPGNSGETYFDPGLEIFSMSHKIITSGPDSQIPEDIANTVISSPDTYTYNGSYIEPKFIVKNGTSGLIEGMDYSLSYKDNKNPGQATATITGKGSYYGTRTETFIIAPAQIEILSAKSVNAGKAEIIWEKAIGVDGYQIVCLSTKNGVYKNAGYITNTTFVNTLVKGRTYYFKVRAYKIVDGKKIYGKYSTAKKIYIKKGN